MDSTRNMPDALLLTRRQAAALFGRSPRFIDSLVKDGILPRFVLPGRQRAIGFRRTDVERLLRADGPTEARP